MVRRERLGWIQFCLRSLGRFGVREKKALISAFGMSDATLSRDQAAFFASIPDDAGVQLERGKLKVVEMGDLDIGPSDDAPNLNEFLRVMTGSNFVAVTSVARARPTDQTVGAIVGAINERVPVFVHYVSRRSENPEWRAISPHAIVDIAGRYHARCFDHLRGRYGDFVLSRMVGFSFSRTDMPTYIDGRADEDWRSKVRLRISLVEQNASRSAKLDYGLDEGQSRTIEVRKALAPYLVTRREGGFEDLVAIHEVEAY
ncbi:MAG: WYL domain-containing protein [Marivita sp.]|uniref:WYL domain-containing protein n=1 Tax=Marivita sp. TaxID=2003365 RepID=UPI0025BDF8C9|nr:WYL domain-containing protein [Marivita sp.]MCI5112766.1 WYL domain-containing protein [Marivita sp.]